MADEVMQPLYTVYCLAERRKAWRVRYIGITKQKLARRLHGHLWDAKRPKRKEHKTNWIRSCVSSSVQIRIHSIRSNMTLQDACVMERALIAKYKPQLVNIHEGGNSGYTGLPEDAKQRHRANTAAALAKIPAEIKRQIVLAMQAARAKNHAARAAKRPKWTKQNIAFDVSFSPCGRYVGLRAINGPWTRCGSERAVRGALAAVLWNRRLSCT